MAPIEWLEMLKHPSPNEFLSQTNVATRKSINAWTLRRKHLIAERIRQELEACFEEKDLDVKPSKPFLKLIVRDVVHDERLDNDSSHAFLTIWGPTSSQLEILQEGAELRARQLSLRDIKYDGMLQLSANSRTHFQAVSRKISAPEAFSELKTRYRQVHGVFQACRLSKKFDSNQPTSSSIDLVGTVIKAEHDKDSPWRTYLTDQSGMVIRLESTEQIFETKQLPPYTAVLVRSVQVSRFDEVEYVGVASLDSQATVVNNGPSASLRRLTRWLDTNNGREAIDNTLRTLNAQLLPMLKMRSNRTLLLAHLVEFCVMDTKQLILKVDCGSENLLHLNLPLSLLENLQVDSGDEVILSPGEESRMARLSKLSQIVRSRSLLRITAILLDKPLAGWEQCSHQILDVSVPSLPHLTDWYASSLQQSSPALMDQGGIVSRQYGALQSF
jgi:hypothetical protein